jgi:hypothetical protein
MLNFSILHFMFRSNILLKLIFYFIFKIIIIILITVVLGAHCTFTKVLTIYRSWIHPLHHSPLSPSSMPGIVSRNETCWNYFPHMSYAADGHGPSYTSPLFPAPSPCSSTLECCLLALWWSRKEQPRSWWLREQPSDSGRWEVEEKWPCFLVPEVDHFRYVSLKCPARWSPGYLIPSQTCLTSDSPTGPSWCHLLNKPLE